MLEDEIKKLMAKEEKKKMMNTIGYDNLKEDAKKEMVKDALASMGKELKEKPKLDRFKKPTSTGMAFKRKK